MIDFHMKKILTQYGVCALVVALMVPFQHDIGIVLQKLSRVL